VISYPVANVAPTLYHERNEINQCGSYRRLESIFSAAADFATSRVPLTADPDPWDRRVAGLKTTIVNILVFHGVV
jgi:hypothetical protein